VNVASQTESPTHDAFAVSFSDEIDHSRQQVQETLQKGCEYVQVVVAGEGPEALYDQAKQEREEVREMHRAEARWREEKFRQVSGQDDDI